MFGIQQGHIAPNRLTDHARALDRAKWLGASSYRVVAHLGESQQHRDHVVEMVLDHELDPLVVVRGGKSDLAQYAYAQEVVREVERIHNVTRGEATKFQFDNEPNLGARREWDRDGYALTCCYVMHEVYLFGLADACTVMPAGFASTALVGRSPTLWLSRLAQMAAFLNAYGGHCTPGAWAWHGYYPAGGPMRSAWGTGIDDVPMIRRAPGMHALTQRLGVAAPFVATETGQSSWVTPQQAEHMVMALTLWDSYDFTDGAYVYRAHDESTPFDWNSGLGVFDKANEPKEAAYALQRMGGV